MLLLRSGQPNHPEAQFGPRHGLRASTFYGRPNPLPTNSRYQKVYEGKSRSCSSVQNAHWHYCPTEPWACQYIVLQATTQPLPAFENRYIYRSSVFASQLLPVTDRAVDKQNPWRLRNQLANDHPS